MKSHKRKSRRIGIYLLPNLFTTAALFFGFYAVINSMHHKFETAAISIFIALILDGLDGRIARMTNTQSDFGAEYDSLADMVSFGLAPSIIVYEWSLRNLGKFGFAAAFIYTACAALRLARFNTQVATVDKAYFQGLPSPSAAALLASLVWISIEYEIDGYDYSLVVLFITIIVGLLMFSNIRYNSFKNIDLKERMPFAKILIIVLTFVLIFLNPAKVLFIIISIYVISGPIITLIERHKIKAKGKK
jgi:CDP-diacylglycerol--serine O-phosphatidyltransferase